MAMNREQKRMLQRQGEIGPDGEPLRTRRGPQSRQRERTGPVEFTREVRSELRKVAWPTRAETINYSIVTIITIIVLTLFIFGIDWIFSEAVLRLFNT